MKHEKRGQSTIEFFILVMVVLFFFLGFLFAIQTNIADKMREGKELAVREIALSVQDEVALASASSDGYLRHFILPNNVKGADYLINITDGLVYVRTSDGKYALALPAFNVTGQPSKGDNDIRKNDGRVYLNS